MAGAGLDKMSYDPDHSGDRVSEAGHSRRVHSTDGGSQRFDDADGTKGSVEDRPLVHKVGNPPRLSVTSQVVNTVKETMFPDDPFRQFKGQTKKRKWILAIQYVFPILEWLPKYKLNLLKGDIIAGLTIASLAIPQVHYSFYALVFYFIWTDLSRLLLFGLDSSEFILEALGHYSLQHLLLTSLLLISNNELTVKIYTVVDRTEYSSGRRWSTFPLTCEINGLFLFGKDSVR